MTLATCALPITLGSSSSLSSVRQRRVAARKTSGIVRASSNASDEVRIVAESTSTTRRQILSTGFAAAVLGCMPFEATADVFKNPDPLGDGYLRFYGEATTSSSYGGYGGNENNFDKFKYFYEIPVGWQPDTVNKTEKSTNGTDSRWVNSKLSAERVYCVSLTGYNKLKEDRQSLLNDLALSDYNLQDALIGADNIEVSEREVDGQTFIDFDLYGFFGAIFASVTVYGGRLYAVFSNVPDSVLEKDKDQGKRLRNSLQIIKKSEEDTARDVEFYQRS